MYECQLNAIRKSATLFSSVPGKVNKREVEQELGGLCSLFFLNVFFLFFHRRGPWLRAIICFNRARRRVAVVPSCFVAIQLSNTLFQSYMATLRGIKAFLLLRFLLFPCPRIKTRTIGRKRRGGFSYSEHQFVRFVASLLPGTSSQFYCFFTLTRWAGGTFQRQIVSPLLHGESVGFTEILTKAGKHLLSWYTALSLAPKCHLWVILREDFLRHSASVFERPLSKVIANISAVVDHVWVFSRPASRYQMQGCNRLLSQDHVGDQLVHQ